MKKIITTLLLSSMIFSNSSFACDGDHSSLPAKPSASAEHVHANAAESAPVVHKATKKKKKKNVAKSETSATSAEAKVETTEPKPTNTETAVPTSATPPAHQ